jgi:hypothetical protein
MSFRKTITLAPGIVEEVDMPGDQNREQCVQIFAHMYAFVGEELLRMRVADPWNSYELVSAVRETLSEEPLFTPDFAPGPIHIPGTENEEASYLLTGGYILPVAPGGATAIWLTDTLTGTRIIGIPLRNLNPDVVPAVAFGVDPMIIPPTAGGWTANSINASQALLEIKQKRLGIVLKDRKKLGGPVVEFTNLMSQGSIFLELIISSLKEGEC